MAVSLRSKIVLICIIIILIAGGSSSLFDGIFFAKEYSKTLQSRAFVIGDTLKSQLDRLLALKIPLSNLVGFEEQCQDLVGKHKDISYAAVVDLNGEILFHNDPVEHGQLLTDPTILAGIRNGKRTSQITSRGEKRSCEFLIPVFGPHDEQIAAVMVGFPMELVSQKTKSMISHSVGFGLLFLGLGIVLLIIALKLWVTNPLSKLTKAIEHIREEGAEATPPVQINSRDEVGQLAFVFNKMIRELKEFNEKMIDYTEHLEAKVEERTSELKSTNEELLRDVTKRQRIEGELRNSRQELRSLSAHLESAREQERTSIAREIHDDLGQNLTALRMDLAWLEKRVPADKRLLDKLKSMSDVVRASIQTVKKVSSELRPRILDDLGLTAAMEWQVGQFQDRTESKCELIMDFEDSSLDQERATAVFRILQETLTNIARHASATNVRIELKEVLGQLRLTVRDDGKGIEESKIFSHSAFGLIGIRERVHMLGGNVRISGVPNQGTIVSVFIPLDGSEKLEVV
jgi:signal transduction histidine kinase